MAIKNQVREGASSAHHIYSSGLFLTLEGVNPRESLKLNLCLIFARVRIIVNGSWISPVAIPRISRGEPENVDSHQVSANRIRNTIKTWASSQAILE
jgi:hypothetical protein